MVGFQPTLRIGNLGVINMTGISFSRARLKGKVDILKYIIKILFLVLIMVISARCSIAGNNLEDTPHPPTLPNQSITHSSTPSATAIITPTFPGQTPSLTSTETLGKSRTNPREINCFQPSFDNIFPVNTNGLVVFSGEFYRSPSYLLDMQSGEIIPLDQGKDEKLTGFAISADKKLLAFQKINTETEISEIQVIASDGGVVKTINWDTSWRKIAGWLDAQTLLISKNQGLNEIDSIVLLNLFTGQLAEIAPSYPNMWIIWVEKAFNWGSFNTSGTIYDSQLTRVIYPISDEQKSGVVLWDLADQKELTSLFGGFGNQPKWRPGEGGFIINLSVRFNSNVRMNEEFFYVDISGNVKQITNLNEADGDTSIGFFNWSPDGNFVAFWLSVEQAGNYPDIYPHSPVGYPNRLGILNFDNGTVIDTCIPGDLSISPPIWSLDGQYLITEDYYGTDFPFTGRVFLANLSKNTVTIIAENVSPIGWMQP